MYRFSSIHECWLLDCIFTTIFYRINKITLKLRNFGYSFSQRFISYWKGLLVIGTELLVIGTEPLVIDTELLVIGTELLVIGTELLVIGRNY